MKTETTDVPIAPCKPEMFKGSEEELAKFPWDLLLKAQCVTNFSGDLIGGYYSDIFAFMELRLELCTGKEYCATPDQIKEYLEKSNELNVYMPHPNVDLVDQTTPIKINFSDTPLFVPLDPSRRTEVDVLISQSILNHRDHLYLLELNDDIKKFHEIEQTIPKSYHQNLDKLDEENRHIRVFFRNNNERTVYFRYVETFYDLLGEIGGVLQVLFSSFTFLTSIYAVESMIEHFMTRLYRFKTTLTKADVPEPGTSFIRKFSEMGKGERIRKEKGKENEIRRLQKTTESYNLERLKNHIETKEKIDAEDIKNLVT